MTKRSLRALLAQRLVVVVLLPWLVIVPVVLLVFVPQSQRQNEQEQHALARNIAAQSRDYLLHAQAALEGLARRLQDTPLTPGQRAALLDTYADAAVIFSAIYLLDGQGNIQAVGYPVALRKAAPELLGKAFVPEAARAWGKWSNGYRSPSHEGLAIARRIALQDGLLLGELNVEAALKGLAARMGHDSPVQLFLLDQQNQLVAAYPALTRPGGSEPDWLPIVRQAREQGDSSALDFTLAGQPLRGVASQLADTEWLLLVARPHSQTGLLQSQSLQQLLVMTLIALLITVPIALLTARALSKRFRRFIAQLLKIAKGNYGLKLADTQIAEIDLLSEHLRLMVNAIKQRELAMVLSADELRISEERLLATLNQTPNVAVQWYDSKGRVLMWNKASEAVYGYSAAEAVGKTIDQLFYTPAQFSDFLDMLRRMRRDQTVGPYEASFQRRDGRLGYLLSTTFCIPGELNEHQFACMDIDITEQKMAEQALQEVNQTLEQRVDERTAALTQTNHELKQAMQTLQHTQVELLRSEKLAALGAMVAGIAHELNTPIGNSVMAASTLQDHSKTLATEIRNGALRRSTLDKFIEHNQTATDILIRNLFRASELISSFKQVAVDQTSEQRRTFRLLELVNEILLTLHPTLKKTPFTVEVDVPEGLWLESYPGPLGQVLVNLINNALTHGFDGYAQGGIWINARALDREWIELAFSDNGCGIPEDNLQRIFDPFFTTRLGQGGSGLGLNITHNLVSGILGGSLSVSSVPGQGTCFVLRLPLVAPGGQ